MTADKIRKIKALMNDSASTENEKLICRNLLASVSEEIGKETEDWREDLYKEMEHVWVTRYGVRVNIKDMKSSHLVNTILYIRRYISEEILEDIPIYINMMKEAKKRGFDGAVNYEQQKVVNFIS